MLLRKYLHVALVFASKIYDLHFDATKEKIELIIKKKNERNYVSVSNSKDGKFVPLA
jgi:hypothetical protein